MAAPPHLSCPPRRRRRRQHLLVSSVVASAASAAAILVALAGLPPPANADSTTIYTRPGVGGAPPTCALPSVKRAAGVASTCPGDRSTASGSPFLVPPAAAAAAAALGYEHEELYTPGGLPPVHVGDTLGDGNYTVVAKLGYGSFSTVWAADHVATGRRVAIKLWRSTGWTTDMADEEHGYLKELAAVDPTAAFPVMRLLDSFVHPSAHGRHQAVVLELMGVSLRVALHAYLHRPGASRRRGAPVRVITTVVRQLLEGLSLAHHHRLLHTDLKLENVALRLPSAAEAAAAAAAAAGTGGDGGAGRDGGGGGGGTAATDVDAEVAAFWSPGGVAHSPAGRIAIIDWGNTERLNDDYILPYAYQLQTESYRSPETIAGIGASPGSDLWSVGCMVWDLAVGRRLFKPDWKAPWGGAVDHLALMADVLGTPDRTFPPWFLTTGAHAVALFEPPPGGAPIVPAAAGGNASAAADAAAAAAAAATPRPYYEVPWASLPPPRLRGIDSHAHTSLAALLADATDYHPAVRASLVDFLTAALDLDPNARPPAAVLLNHEFLTRPWTDEEVGPWPPPSPASSPAPSLPRPTPLPASTWRGWHVEGAAGGGGGGGGAAPSLTAPGVDGGGVAAAAEAVTGR